MAITQVARFITADGKEHLTYEAAIEHENEVLLRLGLKNLFGKDDYVELNEILAVANQLRELLYQHSARINMGGVSLNKPQETFIPQGASETELRYGRVVDK